MWVPRVTGWVFAWTLLLGFVYKTGAMLAKPIWACVRRECRECGCESSEESSSDDNGDGERVVHMCPYCKRKFKTLKVLRQHFQVVHHMRPHHACEPKKSHKAKKKRIMKAFPQTTALYNYSMARSAHQLTVSAKRAMFGVYVAPSVVHKTISKKRLTQ